MMLGEAALVSECTSVICTLLLQLPSRMSQLRLDLRPRRPTVAAPRVDDGLERQHLINIFFGKGRRRTQLFQTQRLQVLPFSKAERHEPPHHLVRLAEGQTFFGEIIRQVGRVRIGAARRKDHAFFVELHLRQHTIGKFQANRKRRHRVDNALFVFLHIFVVSER